jgi:AcrR family transcriptional regulator
VWLEMLKQPILMPDFFSGKNMSTLAMPNDSMRFDGSEGEFVHMAESKKKMTKVARQSSRKPRLRGDERRHSILAKAAALVRDKGEAGVTTRQIAEEAAVSEALLYQHFASKEELFREIAVILNARSPALNEYFAETDPSSRVLVDYLYLLTYLALHPDCQSVDANLPRMLLESLLGDGKLVRTHVKRRWQLIGDILKASLVAAQDAGHLVRPHDEGDASQLLEVVLSHQLIVMAHCVRYVPSEPIVNAAVNHDALIERTTLYILRGIGFKDSVLRRLFQPDKIVARFVKKRAKTSSNKVE